VGVPGEMHVEDVAMDERGDQVEEVEHVVEILGGLVVPRSGSSPSSCAARGVEASAPVRPAVLPWTARTRSLRLQLGDEVEILGDLGWDDQDSQVAVTVHRGSCQDA